MKTIILLLAMFVGSFVNAQSETTGSISVTVPNVSGTDGEVMFGLYTADSFMKTPFIGKKSEIVDGKATVNFENVPKGEYSIIILHDKNLNGRMDFEPNGMPKEDYATSANEPLMGPPTWEDSKFAYDGKVTELEIRF